MRISKTHDNLILSQCCYIEKILDKFDKNENSIVKTSVDVNLYLSKNISDAISQEEYSWIIKSLMFLINCTRPNIIYTINKLSRYTSNTGNKSRYVISEEEFS
jgi:hypothetical protein